MEVHARGVYGRIAKSSVLQEPSIVCAIPSLVPFAGAIGSMTIGFAGSRAALYFLDSAKISLPVLIRNIGVPVFVLAAAWAGGKTGIALSGRILTQLDAAKKTPLTE